MRVGHAFSLALDASATPLFSDQGPLDLLPEELWHASATAAHPPTTLQATSRAGNQAGKAADHDLADDHTSNKPAVSDSDDDSLQPYDLPEEEDERESWPCNGRQCFMCLHFFFAHAHEMQYGRASCVLNAWPHRALRPQRQAHIATCLCQCHLADKINHCFQVLTAAGVAA